MCAGKSKHHIAEIYLFAHFHFFQFWIPFSWHGYLLSRIKLSLFNSTYILLSSLFAMCIFILNNFRQYLFWVVLCTVTAVCCLLLFLFLNHLDQAWIELQWKTVISWLVIGGRLSRIWDNGNFLFNPLCVGSGFSRDDSGNGCMHNRLRRVTTFTCYNKLDTCFFCRMSLSECVYAERMRWNQILCVLMHYVSWSA